MIWPKGCIGRLPTMKDYKSTIRIINKLADVQELNQLARKAIVERLMKMKQLIDLTGLPYSSHMQNDWLRLWEYSIAIIESAVDTRMRILDAGGTGTIFSYYLASEGCEVFTVDISDKKVEEAKRLSEYLGLPMKHLCQSITNLKFPNSCFDRVFCICVIEHLRLDEQSLALKELGRALKPGGILSLTFDYGKKACDNKFLSPEEVVERLIIPSKMEVLGNRDFSLDIEDSGGTSLDISFGSLFLKKPGESKLPASNNTVVNIDPFPALSQKMIEALISKGKAR